MFGSELTKELTGRSDIRPGVEGLFNTVIREIDHEVARILGLESLVEPVRAIVLEIARRRLSRAGEAKREVVKGSEELLELRKPKRKRGGAGGEGGMFRRLEEFMRKSGGEGGK